MTSFAFSKKIALRYLWSKRSEAFITIISVISILGVAIGVMVLTVVMAVMTGFEHTLREKIVGADSHIVIHKIGGRLGHWQEVSEKLSASPDVASISPFTYQQVLIRSEARSTGLLLRGVLPGTASAVQVEQYLDGKQKVDTLFKPAPIVTRDSVGEEREVQLPAIVIGRELARNLYIAEGSIVSVLSPQVGSTPFGLVPKYRRFVVSGTYSSGLMEYESGVAYVDLGEAQRFFDLGDAVSGLEVRVKNVERAPQIAHEILDRLGGLSSGYTVSDWTSSNKALWDAIKLEKKVYFIVLLLIILMASFSIITTLILLVIEKRKDIAIMKTMGASTRGIARIFQIQGAVIGGLGVVLGLALGTVTCLLLQEYGFPLDERVFQMSKLPVRIEWENFALIGICAFTICFVATVYPARRASRLDPSDVLRYE